MLNKKGKPYSRERDAKRISHKVGNRVHLDCLEKLDITYNDGTAVLATCPKCGTVFSRCV